MSNKHILTYTPEYSIRLLLGAEPLGYCSIWSIFQVLEKLSITSRRFFACARAPMYGPIPRALARCFSIPAAHGRVENRGGGRSRAHPCGKRLHWNIFRVGHWSTRIVLKFLAAKAPKSNVREEPNDERLVNLVWTVCRERRPSWGAKRFPRGIISSLRGRMMHCCCRCRVTTNETS